MDSALQTSGPAAAVRVVLLVVLLLVLSVPLSLPGVAAVDQTAQTQPGDTVTVTYEWSSGPNASESTSVTTTQSPDWEVTGSTVTVINETTGTEHEIEWHHSLDRPDTWILEESFGPNETLKITVTYTVPSAATGGQHGFEASASIHDEWVVATDTVSVEGTDDGSDSDDGSDDGTEPAPSEVTVTYEWSSGPNASASTSVTTTESPDWTVTGSTVAVINETTGAEREIEWRHSLGSEDTWILEESFGPNETLEIAVTYAVPTDAEAGEHGFEARASIQDEWVEATDTVSLDDDPASLQFDVQNATAHVNSTATAELEFVATNEGPEPLSSFGIDITRFPSELELLTQTSSGGTWSEAQLTWFWIDGLAAGESVTASVTVEIPADPTQDQYRVRAVASGDSTTVSDSGTILIETGPSESQTAVDAIAGADGRVGFDEVLEGIGRFNTGESVPNTGGETVSFTDVLRLIELFNTGETVSSADS